MAFTERIQPYDRADLSLLLDRVFNQTSNAHCPKAVSNTTSCRFRPVKITPTRRSTPAHGVFAPVFDRTLRTRPAGLPALTLPLTVTRRDCDSHSHTPCVCAGVSFV